MAFYDDWPDYPMTCGAVFTMRGNIQRDAFDRAVAVAEQRHPLVSANVRPGRDKRWRIGRRRWVAASNLIKTRWIGDDDAKEFGSCHPFDLTSEPGVRMWVQQRGTTAKIFVEFHHTACDGAGGMSFIDDIFAVYAAEVNEVDANLPPIDLNLLRERDQFPKAAATWSQWARNLLYDLTFSAHLAMRKPLALASPNRSQVLNRQTWAPHRLVTRHFDREHYQSLREIAVQHGVTLNDYLVSRLFRALRIWNEQYRPDEKGCLRILIPVNLRTRRDLAMPLANRLSYAFLSRPSEQVLDDENLVSSISAENARQKKSGLPRRLLEKFRLMQRLRLWWLIFSPRRCLSTAVFSNLGDPTRRFRTRFPREDGKIRVGNLTMTGFEGTTAVRPHTCTGIFFNTYGNRMTVSTRFDRSQFSKGDAEAFLELFAAQISMQQSRLRAAA